jgi:penicillin-binding protein 1A
MAQAYAPFANGGFLAHGYGIERIRTASGRVLYDHNVAGGERRSVIGSPALQYMNQMLRQVVAAGTGARAAIPGFDIAGKTGTTSDYRDAWFIGYTGGFVTAIWVGRDDNTSMKRITGGGVPAGIWRAYMTAALPKLNVQPIPGGVIEPPPAPGTDPIGDLLAPAAAPAPTNGPPVDMELAPY